MALPLERHEPPSAAALARDIRAFSTELRRRLRAQADAGDLTPSQTAALLRLEADGPATTSALARAEGMRPQSMGAVVSALEAGGLVKGKPDPADGRQTLLSLTDACREWLTLGRAARQDWLVRVIEDRLSDEEQAQLAAALPLLQRLARE